MFADDVPCPCGSGVAVAACLCKDRNFVPPQVPTLPPPPSTGLTLDRCYASVTRDCLPLLTGEHFLSRTVFEFLSKKGKAVGISNHPWQKDKRRIEPIGISSLTTKVLCKRHNSALSPLDKFARRFLEAYGEAKTYHLSAPSGNLHRLFNGYDLERWMLKVLCGICAGVYSRVESPLDHWVPPKQWLSILFGKKRMPSGCGLYLRKKPLGFPRPESSIYVNRIFRQAYYYRGQTRVLAISPTLPRSTVGLDMTVFGSTFTLFMDPPKQPHDLVYRPRTLMFTAHKNLSNAAYIHLGWDELPPTFAGYIVHERRVSDQEGNSWIDRQGKGRK